MRTITAMLAVLLLLVYCAAQNVPAEKTFGMTPAESARVHQERQSREMWRDTAADVRQILRNVSR